jgi:hypothetical protein
MGTLAIKWKRENKYKDGIKNNKRTISNNNIISEFIDQNLPNL